MKLRIFVSLLVAIVIGGLPLAMMWLGGSDFVRGQQLKDSVFAGFLMFFASGIGCYTCPLWSEDE
jgi:hypothetical protein